MAIDTDYAPFDILAFALREMLSSTPTLVGRSLMAHIRISFIGSSKTHDAPSGTGRFPTRGWIIWLCVLGVVLVVVVALISIVDAGKHFLGPQDVAVTFAATTTLGDRFGLFESASIEAFLSSSR